MPPALAQLVTLVSDLIVYGLAVVVIAAAVGAVVGRRAGAAVLALLALGSVAACGFLALLLELSSAWRGIPVGLGLLFTLPVAGAGWLLATSPRARRRAALTWAALWLGFLGASAIGFSAGGRVGLLTITAPAVILFWGALIGLARHTLPLEPDQRVRDAARLLITTILGLNHPLRVLVGREFVERVPGDAGQPFPAGPGLALTGPDHAVAVFDWLQLRGIRGPGVVLTRRFENTLEPLDLRPQQREFAVEAITRDGIGVRLRVAGVFQLDPRPPRQVAPAVALGGPFPFHERSIRRALQARPVEIRRTADGGASAETRQQCGWDDLYALVGTHIVQDIVARYSFSELTTPIEPRDDPRQAITDELRRRLARHMPQHGILSLTANITELEPQEKEPVRKQQIESWQARWQRRVLEEWGAAEADAERVLGRERAAVQAEVIASIGETIAGLTPDESGQAVTIVALRFVESLHRMLEHSDLSKRLAPEVVQTIRKMPRIIGGEGSPPAPAAAPGGGGPAG